MDGRLPIDRFQDENRSVVEDFDDEFFRPEVWIDHYVRKLKELPEQYQSLIPRWCGQPNYIEYWIEKKAMIGTLRLRRTRRRWKRLLDHRRRQFIITGVAYLANDNILRPRILFLKFCPGPIEYMDYTPKIITLNESPITSCPGNLVFQ